MYKSEYLAGALLTPFGPFLLLPCQASSSGQSLTPLLGLGAQEQETGKDSSNLEHRASNIVLCE